MSVQGTPPYSGDDWSAKSREYTAEQFVRDLNDFLTFTPDHEEYDSRLAQLRDGIGRIDVPVDQKALYGEVVGQLDALAALAGPERAVGGQSLPTELLTAEQGTPNPEEAESEEIERLQGSQGNGTSGQGVVTVFTQVHSNLVDLADQLRRKGGF